MSHLMVCSNAAWLQHCRANGMPLTKDTCSIGTLQPIPQTTFPLAEAPAALRQLAAAKHIGKVVVRVGHARHADAHPAPEGQGRWIVTGGLGGLGSLSSHWLVTQGMQRLALLGRSG